MRKTLYIIGLSTFIFSCTSQKVYYTYDAKAKTKTNLATKENTETPKPAIVHQGNIEFYTENIANSSKNNSTISYGSLVSAKPKGFKVTKNYFPALGQNFRQRYIILHYTALDEEKSVRVLSQQEVSSHYLVNDKNDDEIYQLVDENKRAFHAGISRWRNDYNLNDSSIGIEIVNAGFKTDASGKKIFFPFPETQIKKVASLVKDIADRYMISPTNILAHSDITPTRKQDPGALFPWKKLYDDYQIGMWYDETTKQNLMQTEVLNDPYFGSNINKPEFVTKIQTAFQQFGYDITPTGIWDKNNMKIVEAFQYHFRPEKYDGIVDAETWVILKSLIKKYNSTK